MKTFWKVLGIAALAVGLTPYRVEKNEDTGEKKYKALLWRATSIPKGDGEDDSLEISIGFNLPSTENEPHLFSDELCVEYTGASVAEETVPEIPAEPEKTSAPSELDTPSEVSVEAATEET